jgi:hypothetical protein
MARQIRSERIGVYSHQLRSAIVPAPRYGRYFFDDVTKIRMPNWSRAPVSEAACCPSLLAGEGAAFALLGAYVLARELHKAGGDFQRAFAACEARLQSFIHVKPNTAPEFAKSFDPKTRVADNTIPCSRILSRPRRLFGLQD